MKALLGRLNRRDFTSVDTEIVTVAAFGGRMVFVSDFIPALQMIV